MEKNYESGRSDLHWNQRKCLFIGAKNPIRKHEQQALRETKTPGLATCCSSLPPSPRTLPRTPSLFRLKIQFTHTQKANLCSQQPTVLCPPEAKSFQRFPCEFSSPAGFINSSRHPQVLSAGKLPLSRTTVIPELFARWPSWLRCPASACPQEISWVLQTAEETTRRVLTDARETNTDRPAAQNAADTSQSFPQHGPVLPLCYKKHARDTWKTGLPRNASSPCHKE